MPVIRGGVPAWRCVLFSTVEAGWRLITDPLSASCRGGGPIRANGWVSSLFGCGLVFSGP